jgi:hypothetical protein
MGQAARGNLRAADWELGTPSLRTIASGIVTNGTKRAAVNRAETLLSREFSHLVLTLPAGRTPSCGLAVPSARRRRRFYI